MQELRRDPLVFVLLYDRTNQDVLLDLLLHCSTNTYDLACRITAARPRPPVNASLLHFCFDEGELLGVTFELPLNSLRLQARATATTLDPFVAFAEPCSHASASGVVGSPRPAAQIGRV